MLTVMLNSPWCTLAFSCAYASVMLVLISQAWTRLQTVSYVNIQNSSEINPLTPGVFQNLKIYFFDILISVSSASYILSDRCPAKAATYSYWKPQLLSTFSNIHQIGRHVSTTESTSILSLTWSLSPCLPAEAVCCLSCLYSQPLPGVSTFLLIPAAVPLWSPIPDQV